MLDYLEPLDGEDFDLIMFLTNGKKDLKVELSKYIERGEPVEESSMGFKYHIILVKDHAEDESLYDHFDIFEAVLISPLEYISNLIPSGWLGIIAKKTTTSDDFVNKAVANIKQLL